MGRAMAGYWNGEASMSRPDETAALDSFAIMETVISDVWSLLDATSNKPGPSQYLSQQGMSSLQGSTDAAQQVAQTAAN